MQFVNDPYKRIVDDIFTLWASDEMSSYLALIELNSIRVEIIDNDVIKWIDASIETIVTEG